MWVPPGIEQNRDDQNWAGLESHIKNMVAATSSTLLNSYDIVTLIYMVF